MATTNDIQLSDGTVLNRDGTVSYFSRIEGMRIRSHRVPGPDLMELTEHVRSQVVHHLTDIWGNLWLEEIDYE